MVDKVKPGDRIEVSGIFRCEQVHGNSIGVFRTILVATGIKNILMEREKPIMSDTDIKNIKKMSKEKDLFDILEEVVLELVSRLQ